MNRGSLESFQVSVRCGCSEKAPQMRRIVEADKPVWAAIERVDQWLASAGALSRVATITRSTSSSLTVRGAPGRGSSSNPPTPASMKRRRHLPTVWGLTPTRSATARLLEPVADTSTIRARRASPLALVVRLLQPSRVARCSSPRTSGAFGRPIAIAHSLPCHRPSTGGRGAVRSTQLLQY